MAVILKSVTFCPTGGERKNRIQTIESLNRGLFIDAKDSRMLRGMDVETDDVGGLGLEIRIVGCHVALQPVGLQARTLPYGGRPSYGEYPGVWPVSEYSSGSNHPEGFDESN